MFGYTCTAEKNADLIEISGAAEAAGFELRTYLCRKLAARLDNEDLLPLLQLAYELAIHDYGYNPVIHIDYPKLCGERIVPVPVDILLVVCRESYIVVM